AGPLGAKPYLPFATGFADSFACRIVLLRPESRGSVGLGSADPVAHPHIRQKLLATDRDWTTMRRAVALFRAIARQRAIAPLIGGERGPLAAARTDDQLEHVVRTTAVTAHHPAGTCRMGTGIPWRWWMRRFACTARKDCASSTPPCFPTSSAATSTRPW